jgi:hypothetical protein
MLGTNLLERYDCRAFWHMIGQHWFIMVKFANRLTLNMDHVWTNLVKENIGRLYSFPYKPKYTDRYNLLWKRRTICVVDDLSGINCVSLRFFTTFSFHASPDKVYLYHNQINFLNISLYRHSPFLSFYLFIFLSIWKLILKIFFYLACKYLCQWCPTCFRSFYIWSFCTW